MNALQNILLLDHVITTRHFDKRNWSNRLRQSGCNTFDMKSCRSELEHVRDECRNHANQGPWSGDQNCQHHKIGEIVEIQN
jgi:hypothetical protein